MRGRESGTGYYYSPVQVAEILDADLVEVNRLVRRGILPAESVDKYRWIPAKAVEDLIRTKRSPGRLARLPDPRRVTTQRIDHRKRGAVPERGGDACPAR